MPPRKVAAVVAKEAATLEFDDLSSFVHLVEGAEVALLDTDGSEGKQQQLGALVAALSAEEHEALWQRVLDLVGDVLRGPAPASAAGEEGDAADELPARALHAVAALLAAAAAALPLPPASGGALPAAFAEVLGQCQEMLLSISDSGSQALVACALESVVLGSYEGREDYYGGVLMYLIGACVTLRTTAADVARLYRVRHLFAELDWEHESIESMKLQIMRCVASPSFLRSSHSSELLALFFTVHPSFTAEVHSTVKNQVTFCRPGAVKSYASALHKAFKMADECTRVHIEECIQEWILLAIRTVRKSADRARQVLEEIHRHHHEDAMGDLLCKLYGPILWRSLKVANWQVRENAAKLIQYTFPLIPSDLGVAEKEQELVRQLRIFRETLLDPSEPVRRVGVGVVCTVLRGYWDILPPGETAELLTALYSRCARDKKAPTVRAAVCEGFGWVLQNPLSHATMTAVLPHVAELLHDRVPLVRAAFVGLLDVVSHCRGVSVASIVKTDDLFVRLASEHAEGQAERLTSGVQPPRKAAAAGGLEAKATPELVAKRLAKLMAPSLFSADIVQQVTRCVYFLKQNPLALLALLSHVQDIIALAERVKLAAALFRYGLREAAGSSSETPEGCRSVATMLRVVGVLLEGASSEVVESADVPKKRKKGALPAGCFGADVDNFLYEHIKEDDFLGFLKDNAAVLDLRKDLFFALSPLDPKRFPRTVRLVQFALTQACRGEMECALPQLAALVRTASRWGILGSALEVAWERLQAAAKRLGRRQAPDTDMQGALTVLEVVFREADVRAAVLRTEGEIVRDTVEVLSKAFGAAWTKGISELCPTKGEVAILGQAAEAWPRVLGFVVRASLHLDQRLAPAASDSAKGGDLGGRQPASNLFCRFANRILKEVTDVLTSDGCLAVLDSLRVPQHKASVARAPAKKRPKVGALVVADLASILALHERLLEAICATSQLAVLRLPGRNGDTVAGASAGAAVAAAASETEVRDLAALLRTLEDAFWRWAEVAEAQCPSPDSLKLRKAWAFSGRLLHMTSSHHDAADILSAFRVLLSRTSEEFPATVELNRVVQQSFARLELEPELVELVRGVLGAEGAAAGAAPAIPVHDRVRLAFQALAPTFRNLRLSLSGQTQVSQVLPSRGPQKLPVPIAAVPAGGGEEGESAAEAEVRGRSRSPPAGSDSLFDDCFAVRGGSRAASAATQSVAGSVDVQDVH